MENKTILYFGNFDCVNGFAAFNRAVGNACVFDKLGYKTIIYASNSNAIDKDNYFFHNKKILVNSKPFSRYSSYYKYSFYINEIKKHQKFIKCVIVYNMPSFPFSRILRFCKKRGIKVVSDVTEWTDSKKENIFLKPIKSIDTFVRMKKLNYKADALIVVSDFLVNFYQKRIDSNKIIKIYPIMDYSLSEIDLKTKQKRKVDDYIYLGYVGINRKGKDEISKIFPYLMSPDNHLFKLFYIGPLDEKTKRKFNEQDKIICFLDKVKHSNISSFYSKIDFNVVFRKKTRSNNAGFPSKMAESLALGVPVVCNDFSDVGSICREYNCGICLDNMSEITYESTISALKTFRFCNDTIKTLFSSSFYLDSVNQFLDGLSAL